MADPVKAALVGVGWWGAELTRGTRASGRLDVVSCHSRSADNRERFAVDQGIRAVADWDTVLADDEIEAVIVATPHSTHTRLVTEAAEAGKHVFVEKPMTMTVEDGWGCVEAAEKAGVVLAVGHNRRRQGPTRRIRQLLDEGRLGRIVMADTNQSGPSGLRGAADNWRNDPTERPLSGMTPFGVHVIDALLYLLGPIARVTAVRANVLDHTALDDGAVLTLEFESGAVGMLATATSVPTTTRLGVLGSEGAAWNMDDGTRLLVQPIGERLPGEETVAEVDTVAEQMADFADAIRTGGSPEVGGVEGLAVVSVMEAAFASAASGRPCEVGAVR